MKNSIKLLIITSFFAAIFSFNLKAQTYESASLNVTATVRGALSITNDAEANFGNISGTTSGEVFLDPQGEASGYVGATATAGQFTIVGDGTESILIGWPATVTLSDGEGNDIPMALYVSGNGTNNQSSSSDLTLTGGYSTVNLEMSAYYLWVGGSLGTLNAQSSGTYTGTANFTVEYN